VRITATAPGLGCLSRPLSLGCPGAMFWVITLNPDFSRQWPA